MSADDRDPAWDPFDPPLAVRGLLTERIARQLEADLRSGAIAAGTRLPSERSLAQQFGASRNVVREVLRRLEAQRLIAVEAGRGSFALAPRESGGGESRRAAGPRPTVRQLIEARIPVEVETAGLAARRASRSDLETLAEAVRRLATAVDPVEKAHADLAFHVGVAAASGNPVLRAMVESAGGEMFEMMLRSNSDPAIHETGLPNHPELLECIRGRDEEGARTVMRQHLELGLRTYGSDLDERLDVMARRHLDALLERITTSY